jgi:hypothetical protein
VTTEFEEGDSNGGVMPPRTASLKPMSVGVVAAHADVTILVNPGDQGEQSRASVLTSWKSAVEQGLRKQRDSDLAASPISPFDMTAV